MKSALFVLVALGWTGAGCGSDTTSSPDLAAGADLSVSLDLTPPDDLVFSSSCGQPGDPGNALGVGKFCVMQTDCKNGTICTHPFNPSVYFCTMSCSSGGAATQCGDNAICQCQSGQCGCVPAICAGLPEG
jgi:hypothetical protein